jgi:hypothetical protein
MSHVLVQVGKLIVVLVVAGTVGMVMALVVALLGHEVLVRLYGENLAPIDDTPPMVFAVWASYLAGAASGLLVLVVGWRRLARR